MQHSRMLNLRDLSKNAAVNKSAEVFSVLQKFNFISTIFLGVAGGKTEIIEANF